MPKIKKNGANPALVIFATVLVVGGIVATAYFSSHPANTEKSKVESLKSKVGNSTFDIRNSNTSTILLVNADAVTLLEAGKEAQRFSKQEFANKFDTSILPVEGSDAANGSKVYLTLAPGVYSSDLPTSPDHRFTARFGKPKADGAAVIEFRQAGQDAASLVLRDKAGKPLKDASLLGWLDGRSVAFTALASSTRAVYVAAYDGVQRWLAPLPDDTIYLDVRAGAIWYTTATPGEGLESQPRGPSELHRVNSSGEDLLLTKEQNQVIVNVVPWKDAFSYITDDGQARYSSFDGALRLSLGKRKPLLFTADGALLLRDGFDLALFDPRTAQTQKIGSVPEGSVAAFSVQHLDETAK
jgi:hypothetical protein